MQFEYPTAMLFFTIASNPDEWCASCLRRCSLSAVWISHFAFCISAEAPTRLLLQRLKLLPAGRSRVATDITATSSGTRASELVSYSLCERAYWVKEVDLEPGRRWFFWIRQRIRQRRGRVKPADVQSLHVTVRRCQSLKGWSGGIVQGGIHTSQKKKRIQDL